MSTMLIAEPRPDKNGLIVTRHVKPVLPSATFRSGVPAPIRPVPVEEPVEIDDINLMESLGIYDTTSALCDKVEEYLDDEYGASFSYDDSEGVETITFGTQDGADRFTEDWFSGELRSELKTFVRDY